MDTRQVWPAEAEQQTHVRTAAVSPASDTRPAVQAQQTEEATRYLPPRPVTFLMPSAAAAASAPPAAAPSSQPVSPALSALPMWGLIAAAVAGVVLALVTIPSWVPVLGSSVVGTEPRVYWYLSRASGFVAFALFWLSMVSGLIIPNKMARIWPGVFTAFDLHQYSSLLGLGFTLFHVFVLLCNQYVPYNLVQLFVPFVDAPYRPLWIALGQIGLYLSIPVTFTFYIRKQIGNRLWHVIHYLSYPLFAISMLHGLFSGTDSGNVWVLGMYWAGAASLLALTIHRLTVNKSATVA